MRVTLLLQRTSVLLFCTISTRSETKTLFVFFFVQNIVSFVVTYRRKNIVPSSDHQIDYCILYIYIGVCSILRI